MGALWVSTTRANTSTSTDAALARKSARAQASTVAPEVRTSSTSTTRRPAISALRSDATLKAPCTLLARSDRDRPICCWVGRTRRSASEASLTPLCRSMTAPAPPTGYSVGSSRAASAAVPAPAHRPRRAVHDLRAPSSGPSQAPDRCDPGISVHVPRCARHRHSAPRHGRAGRRADWQSLPSTAIRGRDRRQREYRAAGNKAVR